MVKLGYEHWKDILQNYRNYNEALFALVSIEGLENVGNGQKQAIIDICREDNFLIKKQDILDLIEKWDNEIN